VVVCDPPSASSALDGVSPQGGDVARGGDARARRRRGVRGAAAVYGSGVVVVAAREAHPPWWEGFLGTYIAGDDLDDLFNASTSAALLVEAGERLFALTFGHGRHLLQTEAIEQDFGLKVVLNNVAPTQLKSVMRGQSTS
jgi:uncharacterized protein (TIGR04141 family)